MRECRFCQRTDRLLTRQQLCPPCHVMANRRFGSVLPLENALSAPGDDSYGESLANGCACCENYYRPHGPYCPDGDTCEYYEWTHREGEFDPSVAEEHACCLAIYGDCEDCEYDGCASCSRCHDLTEEWYEDSKPDPCGSPIDKHDLVLISVDHYLRNWCTKCWNRENRKKLCVRCNPDMVPNGVRCYLCDTCRSYIAGVKEHGVNWVTGMRDSYEKIVLRMTLLPYLREGFKR